MGIAGALLAPAAIAIGDTADPAGQVQAAAADDPTESAEPDGPTPRPGEPGAFSHPGVLVSKSQLDFTKEKIEQGEEPWKSAFEDLRGSRYADLSWTPQPLENVECGSHSKPNNGCSEERDDGAAAYTQALLWYLTGDQQHARKSIEIMNAWAQKIKEHTNSNARLQTGWSGALFARSGEIIRHTGAGWPEQEVDRFADMLRTVYLPTVIDGAANKNGNWDLIMMDAATGIAVFLDDRESFDKAVDLWRKRLPAYIYLESDGELPKPPPGSSKDSREELVKYWDGQTEFVDGLAQETCRDFGHTGWGIAAAINVAETARHQGLDLYEEGRERLTKALEFHAEYLLGKEAPSWLCGGEPKLGTVPSWEIGFNHYHQRLKVDMPQSQRLIEQKLRPTGVDYFLAWETLTHAGTG